MFSVLTVYIFLNLLSKFCMSLPENITIKFQSRPIQIKDDNEPSKQKLYVVRLNAKLLAQERERLEKSYASNSLSYPDLEEQRNIDNSDYVESFGKIIGSYLRQVSNDELGVTVMQAIYDSVPSTNMMEDSQEFLDEVTEKINKKFMEYQFILNKNRGVVQRLSKDHMSSHDNIRNLCCLIPLELLRYEEHFGTDVALDKGCETLLIPQSSVRFNLGKNLSEEFHYNLKLSPSLLWQYFITSDGLHFEYPAYNIDMNRRCEFKSDRHQDIYRVTAYPFIKTVVIVIDQGYSLSSFQFRTAKAVAKHILNLLSHNDRVAIIGLAADVQYAHANICTTQKILYATSETKLHFMGFIDGLVKKHNTTDHILGFSKAFELIHKAAISNSSIYGDTLIAYISRGLLSSLVDAKQVLETIAKGNRENGNHIIINTYAIIDDEKPVMYEKAFLQDVAEQNFKNYNVHIWDNIAVKKGVMVSINSTEELSSTVGNIFSAFPPQPLDKIFFSLPYWDSLSKGMVISITQQVLHEKTVIGIVGVDISLSDITEDISYFSNSAAKYMFILEESGIALTHPSFSRPAFASEHHMHAYIWHVEDKPGFQNISQAILSEYSGKRILSIASNDKSVKPAEGNKHIIYRWKKIYGTPYIICMVSEEPMRTKKLLKDYFEPEDLSFVYHRLDLISPSSMCRHMKQLSALDTSALFLSAACFTLPYKYLVEEETKQMVQSYMAYLTDATKLIANPGLKAGIRSDVLALCRITPTWKDVSRNSEFSTYIVRRFIATSSGVFQVYPATLIDKTYDASRRDWYIRATEHRGKIILTAPYLDVGGAGYVITLSHTIYEGKPTAMHNSFDTVVAVMGMDFTFGYFYKFLLDKVPICQQDKIICFLLDDRGYLIAHPDLIEPNGRGPVEQQHITHKEPLVANDMLNHKNFVRKKICNSFSDRTIQRFYQLNTSLDQLLTNQVHEQCTKYQIMAVQGTNVFLGIVNETCEGITAFCPCSMTDRLCLNCHRMEQTECECPCECPLKIDLCTGQLMDEEDSYPTCPYFPEEPNLPHVDLNLLESLHPCYEYHCDSRSVQSDCFGIIGCEWCQLEADGMTPLQNKFCTSQRKCFGGVLGARTPYADEIIGLPVEEFLIIKSTPVGPVAGGFMAFFLIMAVAFYCYRNHVRRGSSSHLNTSLPDTNVRMTQLNNEPDELEPYQEPINSVAPSQDIVSGIESAAVSPYCVHTNYRRPPCGDSDHGYSTMTPHEDSEHTQYFDPLLIGKDKSWIPVSHQSASSSSRASSPISYSHPKTILPPITYVTSSPVPKEEGLPPPWMTKKESMQTVLPETHCHGSYILAQVQVHSVDTD